MEVDETGDSEGNLRNTIAIEILGPAIVAADVEVAHVDCLR